QPLHLLARFLAPYHPTVWAIMQQRPQVEKQVSRYGADDGAAVWPLFNLTILDVPSDAKPRDFGRQFVDQFVFPGLSPTRHKFRWQHPGFRDAPHAVVRDVLAGKYAIRPTMFNAIGFQIVVCPYGVEIASYRLHTMGT